MGDISTEKIYGHLYTILFRDWGGGYQVLAAFADKLAQRISTQEHVKVDNVEFAAEIVDVALDHPEDFDVYFSIGNKDRIWYKAHNKDFVICKKGLPIRKIWNQLGLGIEDNAKLSEFYYWLFRVDNNGNVSPTAVAKEFGMPKLIDIKHGSKYIWKYSYYLDKPPIRMTRL